MPGVPSTSPTRWPADSCRWVIRSRGSRPVRPAPPPSSGSTASASSGEGTELTTRFAARSFARAPAFDVVVEQVNTLPYFAPLWSRVPTVLWVNQLAREVWWYEAPRGIAAAGYLAEPLYLQAYRRVPVLTISNSTRARSPPPRAARADRRDADGRRYAGSREARSRSRSRDGSSPWDG